MYRKNLTRILGLSLLAMVAVMAVNAAAAQANWLLLKNLVSVATLKLVGTILEFELLVGDLNLKVFCKKGTISATITDRTPAVGSLHVLKELCSVLLFANCTVHSTGRSNGHILFEGSGSAIWMSSNDSVLILLEEPDFTTIEFLGATCPFVDTVEPVSGGLLLELLEASSPHLLKRLAHLDDHELFFGQAEATLDGVELHGSPPALPLYVDTALLHLEEETGALWAIELTGL
jgi:hypothetical protein